MHGRARGAVRTLAAILALLGAVWTPALGAPGDLRRVAVYYDDVPTEPFNHGKLYANGLLNHLGHFRTEATLCDVEDYSAGDLTNYFAAFYLGSMYRAAPLGETFLADVARCTSNGACRVVWFNFGIWDLVNRADAGHLGVTGGIIRASGFNRVEYKARELFKGTYDFGGVEVTTTHPPVEVLAWMYPSTNPAVRLPYALRSSNFWYVADNALADDVDLSRTLVTADQLHDILDTGAPTNHRALVRTEDLNAGYTDTNAVRAIADYLHGRGIRGSFGVIPRFRDPTGTTGIPDRRMSEAPGFLQALERTAGLGHYLLCHGYTHNNDEESEMSGDGYEFWYHGAVYPGRPLMADGWAYAFERLDGGAEEFRLTGLPMRIWETPHYEASLVDYHAFAARYGVWYERLRVYDLFADGLSSNDLETASADTNLVFQTQYLPYVTWRSPYGTTVLPENLNYINSSATDAYGRSMTVSNKLEYARQLMVVRDAVASFYFHTDQATNQLVALVDGMEALGYTFTDAFALLRDAPTGVTFAMPPIVLDDPTNRAVLAPAPALFAVHAGGGPPLAYQWRRDGTPVAGATGAVYVLGSTAGSDSGSGFDVVVTNAYGSATSRVAALTVHVVVPAVVVDDRFGLPANGLRSVPAPGVLGNDLDPGGSGIRAELVGNCATGSLALSADGSFVYAPPPGFSGQCSFTYRARGPYDVASTNLATVTLRVRPLHADFNADGRSDLAVYDPAAGAWFAATLSGAATLWNEPWGGAGFAPVGGDFDGDGRADLAVYGASAGWYARTVSGGILAWAVPWGGDGFDAIPGDYDGDGRSDLAVFGRATGAWYIGSLSGQVLAWAIAWGWIGAEPVSGDFDGDGASDLAVYDRAAGCWYVLALAGPRAGVLAWALPWGGPDWVPVVGDFDGDGADDLAIFDPASAAWYVWSLDGRVLLWGTIWGWTGAVPLSGDFNGDGIGDLAAFDPLSGAWYIASTDGAILAWALPWGWNGAVPLDGGP